MDGKIVRTHTKAWEVEKQVHTVGDVKLPVPMTLDSLGYALFGVILAALICKIPVIGSASPLLVYLLCVIGLPIGMRKLKIHSKTPLRFVIEYVLYLSQPKALSRFQPIEPKNSIRFTNVNFKR